MADSTSNGDEYLYDDNSNMTTRISGANTYNFAYDVENHQLTVSGSATASFVYDADGVRVRCTTTYIGGYYEWTSQGSTNYYCTNMTRSTLGEPRRSA